ncbi:MAG: hypothetical protein WB709_13425 [Solirubrobacteraceae bacterium]
MVRIDPALSPERVALIQWTARMGAVTAQSLAIVQNVSESSARARLQAAERRGLLTCSRPLVKQPALYTLTRAGMRSCDLRGLDPCRVSTSGAAHLIACAAVAAALEHGYPDHRVLGERELRRDERELGVAMASAQMGVGLHGKSLLHRPDLVLWPEKPADGLPVAVEVELTIKAPRRLADICRAWARCRTVAGVLYIAPPEVGRALERAITRARAHERILVVGLEALPGCPAGAFGSRSGQACPEDTVPSNP